MRRFLVLGLTAICLVGLAACGSSGDPEPTAAEPTAADEVRAAAIEVVESEDSKLFCRRLVSDRFLAELFDGDVAACVESDVVEEDPGEPTVSEVSVRGADESRGEVAVAIEGGKLGGSGGHLEFVKEGEKWKLDRYGDDFLRSNFLVAIRKVDDGAIKYPRMKACMGKQVEELPASRVRRITNDSIDSQATFEKDLLGLAENCRPALAEYAAREFTEGVSTSGDSSPAYVKCLRDEFEAFLLLTDITPALLANEQDFIALAALEGIVEGVKKNCKGERG